MLSLVLTKGAHLTKVASSLVALQAGGYTHPWVSAYTLCTLLIGIALLVAWFIWEWKFARHPMVPFELFKGQRVVALSFAVAFVAGMQSPVGRCLRLSVVLTRKP